MFCDAVCYVTFTFWKLYVLELLHCVQLLFVTLHHVAFTLCCFTLCSNILQRVGNTGKDNEIFVFQANCKLWSMVVSCVINQLIFDITCITCCSFMSLSLALPRIHCLWLVTLKDGHFRNPCTYLLHVASDLPALIFCYKKNLLLFRNLKITLETWEESLASTLVHQ
jgi:hypothetical protein